MVYVVVGPNCYGSGDTLSEAIMYAKSNWYGRGSEKMPYNAYEASDDWDVDHTGTISATTLNKLEEYRP